MGFGPYLRKFKIVAKTKELKGFNQSMADKTKEMTSKFLSHAKILEKIQEDLQYIHQTIKMVEHLDNNAPVTEDTAQQTKPQP